MNTDRLKRLGDLFPGILLSFRSFQGKRSLSRFFHEYKDRVSSPAFPETGNLARVIYPKVASLDKKRTGSPAGQPVIEDESGFLPAGRQATPTGAAKQPWMGRRQHVFHPDCLESGRELSHAEVLRQGGYQQIPQSVGYRPRGLQRAAPARAPLRPHRSQGAVRKRELLPTQSHPLEINSPLQLGALSSAPKSALAHKLFIG